MAVKLVVPRSLKIAETHGVARIQNFVLSVNPGDTWKYPLGFKGLMWRPRDLLEHANRFSESDRLARPSTVVQSERENGNGRPENYLLLDVEMVSSNILKSKKKKKTRKKIGHLSVMMPLEFRKIVTFVVTAPKPRTFDLLLRAALNRK